MSPSVRILLFHEGGSLAVDPLPTGADHLTIVETVRTALASKHDEN